MYLERLNNYGLESSMYYQSPKFNKSLGTTLAMPNCTNYDVLRGFESCEASEPFVMFSGYGPGGYPGAEDFYRLAVLPKGKTLKAGSFVCFTNHVAYLESVNANGTCTLTDSRYDKDKTLRNDRYWRRLDNIILIPGQKPNIKNIGEFTGCVYLPIKDIRVNRDYNKEQIELTERMVNVRTAPDGHVYMNGCYAPMGIYDVLRKQEHNGYMWYELEKDHWVREGDWLRYYEMSDIVNLKKENEELKRKLKEIHSLSEVQ